MKESQVFVLLSRLIIAMRERFLIWMGTASRGAGLRESESINLSLPMLVSFGIGVTTLILWQALLAQEKVNIKQAIQLEAANAKYEITRELSERTRVLERMSDRWDRWGKPSKQAWEADAALLVKHYGDYQAIQWVDPSSIVRWIVPLSGNEPAQNLNLAFEKRRQEALAKARNQRRAIATHTIDLVQGGRGFLIYLPIFEKRKFAGFIVGVFHTQEFLDKIFNQLDKRVGRKYAISIFDGNDKIYSHSLSNGVNERKWGQESRLEFNGITWRLRVWPEQQWLAEKQSSLPTITLIAGLLMAWLLASAIYLAQTLRQRAKKVEDLNRRLEREISDRALVEQRLATQYLTVKVLAESDNLNSAIPQILKAICNQLKWDIGELWEVDPQANVLRFVQIWHHPSLDVAEFDDVTQKITFAPGIGLPGRVWKSGEPTWIADVVLDSNFPRAEIAEKSPWHGAFGFPIVGSQEILGVLTFLSREIRQPDTNLHEMLGAIGSQIGQFIERKRADRALQETTTLQRAILDSANYTIISCNTDGIIRTFNAGAERLLGYTAAEAIGKFNLAIIHDAVEIASRANELSIQMGMPIKPGFEVFVALVRQGGWDEREWTYIRKDGSRFPVLLSITALRDADNNIVGFLGIGSDISDRKQTRKALEKQREWLEVTLSSIGDAAIATDTSGSITFINPIAEVLTGWLADEALGKKIEDVFCIINDWTRQPVEIPIKRAIEERIVVELDDNTILLARDGREIPIDDSAAPILSKSGNLQGAILIFRNVLERRHSERALRASKEQLQAIYDGIGDGILIVDIQTLRFLSANPAIGKMLGYSEAELLSLSLEDIHPVQHFNDILAGLIAILENKIQCAKDSACLRKDGSLFFADINARQILYKGHLALICLFRDITDRKQAEEEIRNALAKEKELNELKSRFVSMTSHEFRTPLSTILFSAGLLENYGHKWEDDKKLTHLHRIQDAVGQMTSLLDDVLLIGQVEAGKLEFKPVDLDLVKFCSDLVEEIQNNAGTKYSIAFICQDDFSNAKMDEKLLRHIFSNLLSNAIKYSPQGGNVRFELARSNKGEEKHFPSPNPPAAIFRIQDEGIGIPLEDQKRLFETFHRAKNVGTISGTGLGLAIVKNSVELHGGKVAVESQVGVGTTFIVTLPLISQAQM